MEIRLVKENDCQAILNIYTHYILHTAITFEYDVPRLVDFSQRISSTSKQFPWLVCTHKNGILGYAYANYHRMRTAYQWSAESTIYLAPQAHRKGIGRRLYQALFEILKLQGYINVYAGVTIPNVKSESFHESMGFIPVGTYSKIGYKFNKWHDVKWYQRHLATHAVGPPGIKPVTEATKDIMLRKILKKYSAS